MSTLQASVFLGLSLNGIDPPSGIDPSLATGPLFDGSNTVSVNPTYSVPILGHTRDTYGIQVSVKDNSGAPNGTFSMQGSNDVSKYEDRGVPDANLVNWAAIAMWDEATGLWVASKAMSAGPFSWLLTVQVASFRWMRCKWVNTSGTANLIIRMQSKSDGGR